MTDLAATSVDPPPAPSGRRREAILLLAAVVAVTSLFYYEVVFLGRSFIPVIQGAGLTSLGPYGFNPADQRLDLYRPDRGATAWGLEPWTRKASDEYAAGRFPTWNDDQAFGAPLLGNAQSGAMDPLRLPVLLSGSPGAWDAYYLLRVVGGLVVAYLFARTIGLRPPASLFLAVAYVFSGHFLVFGNAHWVEIYFLLPAILLGTELLRRDRLRSGFLVTALSVGLAILGGMPEATLLVLLAAAAYGAYAIGATAVATNYWRPTLGYAAVLAGAWVTGIALAAPMLLTLAEYVPLAFSIHPPDRGLGLAVAPFSDFAHFGIPFLNGRPLEPLSGTGVVNLQTYVGATVLVLAAYGVLSGRSRQFRGLTVFAFLLGLLILAKTYGTPNVNELGRLPGLNVTWFPRWSAPIAAFALVLLAAVGVHRLAAEPARPLAAALALVAFVVYALVGLRANQSALEDATRTHLLGTIGIAAVFAIATWAILQSRQWFSGKAAALACCGLVAVELFAYAPHDAYQERYDPLTEAPYVDFLQAQERSTPPFRIFATNGLLFPNLSNPFDIDDIRSLDALYVDRYLTYVKAFLSPEVTDRYTGAPYASSEKETLMRDNPWFDLAGVKYVVTNPGAGVALTEGDLIQAIVDANGGATPSVHPDSFTIDGESRPVLFHHPPSTLTYAFKVTADRQVLRFALALSPNAWPATEGDGVGFDVAVQAIGGPMESLFHRDIDPKHNEADRHWLDDSVDLSRYLGADVVLTLTTTPLARSDTDWAGWGNLRLTSATDEPAGQYRMVYDAEVQIFENTHVLPRALLVGSVLPVDDETAALAAMKSGEVDPAVEAVVEDAPPDAVNALQPGSGQATVTEYDTTTAVVDTQSAAPALLVLADTYYPGWTATVDGAEAEVHATNLAFRGVFVPAGNHTIVFSYEPESFRAGLILMTLAMAVVAGVAVLPLARRGRRAIAVRRRGDSAPSS